MADDGLRARERWWRGARHLSAIGGLAVLPVIALVTMVHIGVDKDSLAYDFHHELYPQTKLMLEGTSPYPPRGFDPTYGANLIWPPFAALLVAPFTLLPLGSAELIVALLGPVCFAVALALVGVRDWRVYGALGLWPQVVGEVRLSHLTPVLALLAAAAWRARNTELRSGLWVGLAVGLKFFVWPLGVWLASIGRMRGALVAALVALLSLLLVLPFTGLDDYVSALLHVGRGFDQASYTPYGLLVQSGMSDSVARVVTLGIVLALLWATWVYRSFTLAIATALAASPIVWLDFFGLAAIPLAIARPRLSFVWFVPLGAWGLEGAGLKIADAPGTARLLILFGIVFAVAFRGERAAAGAPQRPVDGLRPACIPQVAPDR
jgi:hypothetical protein